MAGMLQLQAQTLKVTLSPDKTKVDRSTNNGTATIFFDSNVDDLSIICTDENPDEPIKKVKDKLWYTYIDVKKDIEEYNSCYRNFLLKSKYSAEFFLTTPEIGYNQVLYYTVVLPKLFPVTLSVEWLMNLHVQKGIRISYGGRYGFIVGGTLGEYRPSGDNIDKVTTDCDLSYADRKGYIRTAVFGGFRMGLINVKDFSMYSYLGVGYGEHGCQWENRTRLENSKYFYSDYIKGVNTNFGLSLYHRNMICSFGGDMIIEKNKYMLEWQLGFGFYLNANNCF